MTSADRPEASSPLRGLQMAFAAHIRNPDKAPIPAGVEDRRMRIYRDLFFNNISKYLAGNFPVLRKIYGEEAWRRLAREFYDEHRAHTPMFPEIPKEFLRYVQEQRVNRAGDPPFLLELAHYEWVELAMSLDTQEIDQLPCDPQGDLMTGVPLLSPLAWPLAYRFPVHRISPEYQPQAAPEQPTRLLVYRNREDQVKFMEINPVTWLLLEKLQAARHTGQEILQSVADAIGRANDATVLEHGQRSLLDLRQRDVILGTQT